MPDKSVREMSLFERQHYSLSARVFRSVIGGAVLLGLAALLIGLGLYTYAVVSRYINTAFNLSRNTAAILEKVVDPQSLTLEVMRRYRALPHERWADPDASAYVEEFADITEREDYQTTRAVLQIFLESSDVSDIFLGMVDRATTSLVCVVDPGMKETLPPGYWTQVKEEDVEKFLNWDNESMLYFIEKVEGYGWVCTAGVPLRNDNGTVTGYILADVTLGEVAENMKNFVLQYAIAMFFLINLFAFFMVRHMHKTLVEPINGIAEAAKQYVQDKKDGKSFSDHFTRLNIRTGDEIENLALTMADMEQGLSEFEENLTAVTAEKERIGTELSLATRIQADMLPNIFPPFPDRPEMDVYASMNPAKEVGGDFYDFFLIDENRLGLVIADVSGKGVPAALFMMMAKIMLQNFAMTGRSPKEVLEEVNTQICKNNREEMFVTVWLGILDLTTGRMTAANAGHEYPILKKPGSGYEILKDKHGFVIGGMAGVRYKEYELQLEPGSRLFVYTDGLPEATNAEQELFGTERVLKVLNEDPEREPRQVLETIDEAVALFVGEAPQFDDLTMLCLEYRGKTATKGKEDKGMTIPATLENIPVVTDYVNEELKAHDCPLKAMRQIDVAIDELFGNIARYAYNPDTGPATIQVEVDDSPAVILTFMDHGRPYDPLAKTDPDTTLSAEEREIGGLGIFLVKKTMDDITYEYKDGQNILRIRKNI